MRGVRARGRACERQGDIPPGRVCLKREDHDVSSRNFTERETETGGGRRRRCARTPGRICSINGSLSDYFVPSGRLRVGSALEGPVPRADAGAEPAPHGPPRRQSQLRIPCPTNDDR